MVIYESINLGKECRIVGFDLLNDIFLGFIFIIFKRDYNCLFMGWLWINRCEIICRNIFINYVSLRC